jgi:hypothetical protein
MNVEELLHTVREDYLDDTVEPPRWGSRQLLRWLNLAQKEACRRQKFLIEDNDPTISQIALVALQGRYNLDGNVHMLERVVFNGKTIPKATKPMLDRIAPAWREFEPGEPMFYLQNDLEIRLIPAPSDAEDTQILYLTVWHLPLVDLVTDSDVPVIPLSHHEELCTYVASRAFMQPDEDTQNTNLADTYMRQFDAAFGPPLSADVIAHKRREAKTSHVGPGHAYHGRKVPSIPGRNPFDFDCE